MDGLKDVGLLLKDDHRLVKDVNLWGEVIPNAIREAYGKDMTFAEICEALEIPAWDQDYLSNQFEKVSDFALYVLS